MKLIIFTPPLNVAARNLIRSLEHLKRTAQIQHFGDIASLAEYLRRPMGTAVICILFPANNLELRRLNNIRHLLRDMRLILILPDGKPETISDGHALRPRYVSYADCPLADVAAVVDKMIGQTLDRNMAVSNQRISK